VSLRSTLIKGGLQVAVGQLGQQLLLLGRNVFTARLLPEQQFGVALTLMTVLTALDALTDLGIEVFIVRSRATDSEDMQKTLHAMMIVRGLFMALGLFLVAGTVARLFGVPQSAETYRWLAIVPIIRSFIHLDFRRFERTYRFGPGIFITFFSFLASAVVAVLVAWQTASPIAIVAGSVAQMVVLVIGSHLVAERKYGLTYNADYVREMMQYGTPLILNGVLLFSLAQGDRIIIGSVLGVRELENYGVVSILTSGIATLIMRVTAAIYLPLLAEHQVGTPIYLKRYEACGAITVILALMTVIPLAFFGFRFTQLAFGQHYSPTSLLVTLLATQVALKVMRSWPQRAFLANAQTSLLFYSNLIAATGLVSAYFAAQSFHSIEVVAACLVASELIAALHSVYVVAKHPGFIWIGLRFMGLLLASSAALIAMQYWGLAPSGFWNSALYAGIVASVCLPVALAVSPSISQIVRELLLKSRLFN
jgi:O-antigen/teichoic acid export membrane protein